MAEKSDEVIVDSFDTNSSNGSNSVIWMTMRTSRIYLRPFNEELDSRWYYKLATSEDNLYRWRFRGTPPTWEVFTRTMFAGLFTQFVVESVHPKEGVDPRIGLVTAYNADFPNGTAYFGVITNRRLTGLGFEATALFLTYLFLNWPFRKLYFEMPAYNQEFIMSGVDRYFKEEGRLKSHEFLLGRYWDHVTYAIYRDEYLSNERVRTLTLGKGLKDELV